MRNFLFIILLFLFGCDSPESHFSVAGTGKAIIINANDPSLHFQNGYRYYKGKLFSGIIEEHFKDQTVQQSTQYENGKENGWSQTFFTGGKIAEKRFYLNGEKDSAHTGWWPNGNRRFEYHFSNGIYNGDYKEWYESGKLLKHVHYVNGVDSWGKGWRENGKIYMNFVMKEGRRYGLNNSNLCYTVKKGNGEFVASVEGSK